MEVDIISCDHNVYTSPRVTDLSGVSAPVLIPAAIIENLIRSSDVDIHDIPLCLSLSSCISKSIFIFYLVSAFSPLPDVCLVLPLLSFTAEQAGNRISPVLSGHGRHRISAVWLQHRRHQCSRAGLYFCIMHFFTICTSCHVKQLNPAFVWGQNNWDKRRKMVNHHCYETFDHF